MIRLLRPIMISVVLPELRYSQYTCTLGEVVILARYLQSERRELSPERMDSTVKFSVLNLDLLDI